MPGLDLPSLRLHEAMHYAMKAGGKRLRPALLVSVAEGRSPVADPWPAAFAVEAFHTYSLIHDDLPAMDNSPTRRGKPTLHMLYDEATAILAGDAFLNLSFETLSWNYRETPEVSCGLIRELSLTGNSHFLIGGQMEDILAEKKSPDPQTLDFIHRGKTAALLSACLKMGGWLGGYGEDERKALGDAGVSAGVAFQIIDDILDATSTAENLGKQAGADAASGKTTWVSLHGLEQARIDANRWTMQALDGLRKADCRIPLLEDLLMEMRDRSC